jgi:hypothetical protein
MGQTYPLPEIGDEWAQQHLAVQDERVGPYPEQLESTLATDTVPVNDKWGGSTGAASDKTPAGDAHKASMPPTNESPEPTTEQPAKHEVQVDYEPRSEDAVGLADSPVRRLVGQPRSREAIAKAAVDDHELPLPDTLRELTFLDRINEIAPTDQLEGTSGLPRLYNEDYAVLALLDRVGLAPPSLIGRAALPGRATRSINDRLIKLYRHGLIARHNTGLRERTRTDGKAPVLYSLTRRGLQVAQGRTPAPAISPKREWRPIEQPRAGRLAHDLHALGWAIEFHRTVGELATDRWRTPRYATGRYPVPQVGSGQRRHPATIADIKVPDGQAIIDLELKTFTEIKPDVSLELRSEQLKFTCDLLVEIDLTERPSYNRDKFIAYDAFLCGWALAHPRYRSQGTRPAVVFVCPNDRAALACAREADELMTGRIGVMGTQAEHWYYAGRDHMFFAVEADIHRSEPAALALQPVPLALRERLLGNRDPSLIPVRLIDPHDGVAETRRIGDPTAAA